MDEALIGLARWFSWRRQRLDRSCRGVDDCLRSVIGISGHHPSAPLSLLARVPRLMHGMYEGSVEGRVGLRIPAMRRALHLLHGETAHLAYRATMPPQRNGKSQASGRRIRAEVLRAANQEASADDIKAALRSPPDRLTSLLASMANEASLLRLRAPDSLSNSFSFIATRTWLGHGLPPADPDGALMWLAGEYITTYGPATVEDFAFWSGADDERAREALAPHDIVDIGNGYLMRRTDARQMELARPVAGRVNLLPALDSYTMGYAPASRERFADRKLLPYLYDKSGSSTSVVLIEGEAGGLWELVPSKESLEIRVGLFDDPGPKAWAAIQSEAALIAGYLDARDFSVSRVKVRSAISRTGGKAATPLA